VPASSGPLRADAQRNRENILVAARAAFASDGPEVPLDRIAALAGVGAGTVHRHFPSKNSLIAAVVADSLERLGDRAQALAQDAADPTVFFDFLRELTLEARDNAVLYESLGDAGIGPAGSAAADRLNRGLATLLEEAQRAGTVRAGLTAADLHVLLGGAIGMERRMPLSRKGLALDIIIAGLRGTD
jgi:AcrR family transcriptional regulator